MVHSHRSILLHSWKLLSQTEVKNAIHPASSFSKEKGVGPVWDNGNTQTNGGWPQKVGKQIKTYLSK